MYDGHILVLKLVLLARVDSRCLRDGRLGDRIIPTLKYFICVYYALFARVLGLTKFVVISETLNGDVVIIVETNGFQG